MKTSEELGITETERQNLIKVRDMFNAAEISLVKDPRSKPKLDAFNMNTTCSKRYSGRREHDCGSVMCIGGWVKTLELNPPKDKKGNFKIDEDAAWNIDNYVRNSRGAIRDLYYVHINGTQMYQMHSVTCAQASRAIDNFLEHGEPRWKDELTARQLSEGW